MRKSQPNFFFLHVHRVRVSTRKSAICIKYTLAVKVKSHTSDKHTYEFIKFPPIITNIHSNIDEKPVDIIINDENHQQT